MVGDVEGSEVELGERVGGAGACESGGREWGVGLGVAEDVGSAGLGWRCVGRVRIGVVRVEWNEREDVGVLEVLEETVEVGELLAAASKVGALVGVSG